MISDKKQKEESVSSEDAEDIPVALEAEDSSEGTYEDLLRKRYAVLDLEKNYDEAKDALAALLATIGDEFSPVSVGLGLTSEQDKFILKVLLSEYAHESMLPKTINGIDIETMLASPVTFENIDIEIDE